MIEDDPHDRGTDQNSDEAVTNRGQVDAGFKSGEEEDIESQGHLESGVRQTRAAARDPGEEKGAGSNEEQQPDDRIEMRDNVDDGPDADDSSYADTRDAKGLLLTLGLHGGKSGRRAGDHACANTGPGHGIHKNFADGDGEDGSPGKSNIFGVSEGVF